MTKASDNEFPSILFAEEDPPAAPSTGFRRLFLNSSNVNVIGSNSSVRALAWANASGGGIAETLIDAKGDLIVGSAADTAARLAVGTNNYVLTADTSATNGVKWAAVAAGDARPYLSRITLAATYGDDFTGGSLDAKWTQRGSASHTYQSGDGSWLRMAHSSGASELIYQTAPAGDFEIVVGYMIYQATTDQMIGPCIVDSSGTGVIATFYTNPVGVILGTLTTWAYATAPQTLVLTGTEFRATHPLWLGLKKASTAYSFRYSLNGYEWSPYSATSTQSFTVAYIGFGRHYGTATNVVTSIDVFNVI